MSKYVPAENLCLSSPFFPFPFFFFCPLYHSPAERAVLDCQLGPACTSQGRGRHSQTQPESIQACNTVPFDSPHSSDFSQAEIAKKKLRDKSWNTTRWTTRYNTKGKRKKRWGGKKEEELWMSAHTHAVPDLHLICTVWASKNDLNSDPQQSTDF